MFEVMTIGEPMVLFVADTVGSLDDIEHFTKSLAGAEVNVSIGLKRLGHKVRYITKLGQDPFGKYIYKVLSKEQIDTSYVKFDEKNPTGFQIKGKTLTGDPEVVNFRRGSAASHIAREDIASLELNGVKHIHVTGIPLALSLDFREALFSLVALAKGQGIRLTFDPNLRPKLWESKTEMVSVINALAEQCDIVLPGISEGAILMGSENPHEIADYYLEKGVKAVLIKLGEQGTFVKNSSESFLIPGFKVGKVVDTVGAGDAFAVGLISGLLEGLTLRDSVIRGNAIGALQVMTPGDNDGLPDQEELSRFLLSKGQF